MADNGEESFMARRISGSAAVFDCASDFQALAASALPWPSGPTARMVLMESETDAASPVKQIMAANKTAKRGFMDVSLDVHHALGKALALVVDGHANGDESS